MPAYPVHLLFCVQSLLLRSNLSEEGLALCWDHFIVFGGHLAGSKEGVTNRKQGASWVLHIKLQGPPLSDPLLLARLHLVKVPDLPQIASLAEDQNVQIRV